MFIDCKIVSNPQVFSTPTGILLLSLTSTRKVYGCLVTVSESLRNSLWKLQMKESRLLNSARYLLVIWVMCSKAYLLMGDTNGPPMCGCGGVGGYAPDSGMGY